MNKARPKEFSTQEKLSRDSSSAGVLRKEKGKERAFMNMILEVPDILSRTG